MRMWKSRATTAMTSSMMRDRMVGKTIGKAMEFVKELKGVPKFPNRAHCAVLAWDTLEHGVMEYSARRDGEMK